MQVPQRRCVICRQSYDQNTLIRMYKKDEKILINQPKTLGRGVYICNNNECISKAKAKRLLSKVFKMPVDDNVYDELTQINKK